MNCYFQRRSVRIRRFVVRSFWWRVCVAVSILAGLPWLGRAGAAEIAADFTLPNHNGGPNLRLYDYSGQIILLEFFYWWCPPCQKATPDVEANIDAYYKARHGNPAGVSVTVIDINLEEDPAHQADVDAFIRDNGLTL